MPDKFTKIDKKFTDQAWNEMSKMLDKEMPVSSSKKIGWKRYLLLLLLVSVGFGAAYGLMAAFSDLNTETKSTKTERPVAKVEKLNSENSLKANDSKVVKDNFNDSKKITSQTVNSNKVLTSQSNEKKSVSSLNSKQLDSKKNNVSISSDPPKNSRIGSSLKTAKTNNISISIDQLNALPLLNINGFPIENNPLSTGFEFVGNGKNKKGLLNPDVLKIKGDGIFHPIKTIDGLGGSLVFGYKLNNPKLGFETGIGYQFLTTNPAADDKRLFQFNSDADELAAGAENSLDFSPKPNFDITVPVDVENNYTVSAEELQDTTGTFSLINFPMDLHYLRVPFEIYYQISPRWNIKGGMNLSLLLSSPSPTTGGLLNFENSINNQKIVANGSYREDFFSNEIPIRKLDLGASLGMSYKFSKNIEGSFQYNFGLIDHFNLNNLSSKNRYFQLSLAYNFNLNR